MFNDTYGLTSAVLEGRKTQTRRVITTPRRFRGQDVNGYWVYRRPNSSEVIEVCMKDYDDAEIEGGQIRPKYDFDEIIAVAQSYGTISESISSYPSADKAKFYCDVMKACYPDDEIARDTEDIAGWDNKMFVKSELMPHQIRITDVRVERLQDISEDDCLKEGINYSKLFNKYYFGSDMAQYTFVSPREAYAALIDKLFGEGTWDKNPYVFAYTFEKIK